MRFMTTQWRPTISFILDMCEQICACSMEPIVLCKLFFKSRLYFISLIIFIPLPSYADAPAIGIGIGTLGEALSVSQPIDASTAMRFTYGTYQFSHQARFDNVVIDVQTNLRLAERFQVRSAGLYLDRAIERRMHVTVGAVFNQNHIAAVSVPADSSLLINHYVYSAAQAGEVFTDVRWMPVSPYIGFGFNPRPSGQRRFALVAEVGAFYQGPAIVRFDANGAIKANQSLFSAYFNNLQGQLARELSPVQVYPVVQVGFRLRL